MQEEPQEDGETLRIIHARERYCRYAQCFPAKQAAKLLENKSQHLQIYFQDPEAKMPTEDIYKTTL